MLDAPAGTVTAVLGPTNTGKTHYAIERMLARDSGIIGLPLRLLAREIYDKIVALRGPQSVSLITGEEKISPPRARYHVCTVEAMPLGQPVDFVAVDEIQLCADPDRGHVFTHRLLHARGRYETLLLGSDTMRARIASLVPGVRYHGRTRYSTLSWTGSKKLSRLKPRTAVVAFSIDQVYAIAELIRRQRGGAAVVMGALSPRTRNAQVALYQEGDVDYMVATDAIGMGLNMDVDHVAFAGTAKFDGWRHRALEPNELAQIAGRAGRYTKDGTFGVTGEASQLAPETIEAIEQHRFRPVSKLMWRNSDLRFHSVAALLASLDAAPGDADLVRAPEAEDQAVLRTLWEDAAVREVATRGDRIRLLWEVCQIPDFRKVSPAEHATLVGRIYRFLLADAHCIPSDWLAGQIERLDRVHGDIDALSKRLAYIRTWTYVANRPGWIEDVERWRGETRAVEDRLSDALHERLTQRFVDRRTSVLMRRLKQKERLLAEVNDKGEVTAEGHFLGRLDGFRFTIDSEATGDELKTLRSASLSAVGAELARRADKLYLSPDSEIDLTDQGGLMWGADAVGRISKGDDPLAPKITVFVDDMADQGVAEKVERRLRHWLGRRVNALFEPMLAMRDDEAITGLARGVAFRLAENFGVVPRREIADDVKALGQEDRALLRKHGVRFGQHFVFMPALLKPAPTRLRLLLWSLARDLEVFPDAPPPGHVTVGVAPDAPEGYYHMSGYRPCGARALRIDMLERLADLIRPLDARTGFEATQDMLSITGCTHEQFAELMAGLGYQVEKGERPKPPKPPRADAADPPLAAESGVQSASGTATPADEVERVNEMQPGGHGDAPADAPAAETLAPGDGLEFERNTCVETASIAEGGPAEDAELETARPAAAPLAALDADAAVGMTSPGTTPAAPLEDRADQRAGEAGQPAADSNDASPSGSDTAGAAEEHEGRKTGTDAPPETEAYFVFRSRPRNRARRGSPQRPVSDGRPNGERRHTRRPKQGDDGPGTKPPGEERRATRGDGKHAVDAGNGRDERGGDGLKDGRRGKGAKDKRRGEDQLRRFEAKPARQEKPVDPDSPFAILQQLKNR
jgi:ATP-dependent RNA helicase SUPV3L1/SUV3